MGCSWCDDLFYLALSLYFVYLLSHFNLFGVNIQIRDHHRGGKFMQKHKDRAIL